MSERGYVAHVGGLLYQYDAAGNLRRIEENGGLDWSRPFYMAPAPVDEDAALDQGDEHCEDCGQDLTMDGCGCEPGEWKPMGYVNG